jgi:hypothetical protein
VAPKETPISGAKNVAKSDAKGRPKRVAKVDKVDIKRTIKIAKKGRQKVALFNCVFLDTKKRKSGSLIICILY